MFYLVYSLEKSKEKKRQGLFESLSCSVVLGSVTPDLLVIFYLVEEEMKELYLIIYLLGKAAVGFGPLTYGMDECWKRSEVMKEAIYKDFDEGTSPFQDFANKKEDITTSCNELTPDELLKLKQE